VPRQPVCGGYAEYHVASERSYVRFPQGTPLATAALAELLTCLASAVFRAGDVGGKRVGVSGLGPAGLLAVQVLKARGAAEVLAFDVVPERIALARELGADGGMIPESPEWEQLLPRAANLDTAIDCIGLARSVTNLMRVTRDHLVIFGVPHGEIRYGMAEWGKALRLDAAGPRLPEGAEYAAELLASGQVRVDRFIEHTLPLERYDEGVRLLMDKRAIKVAFDPRLRA
jgi:threonine dehydrogenase-like Zn-dependent dehydrogenase